MLDGCYIILWVFVVRNKSGRLKVAEGSDEDSFGLVTFALVKGTYCRIEFVVFIF